MRVLVDDLGLAGSGLVSNVVDAVILVGFAIGIDHGRVVSLVSETLFLQVSFLVAVPADDVEVPGAAGAGLAIVAGLAFVLLRWEAIVASSDGGDLLNLLFSQILSDDLLSLFWWKLSFDGVDFVQPFVIILNGFQVASSLHAFIECCFSSLQDLVTDAVLEAGQEELMLNELEGVCNAFRFSFLDSRSCCSDSSHGDRLVVSEVLVGHLDAVGVVIDGLVCLLGEVREKSLG